MIIASWLNRAGIFLDIIAFFFAAPELLGEDGIVRSERFLERQLLKVVNVSGRILKEDVRKSFSRSVSWKRRLFGSGCIILFIFPCARFGFVVLPLFSGTGNESWFPVVWVIIFFTFAIAAVALLLGPGILRALSDDRHIRLRWLRIGAACFLLGNILQLIASFL